MTTLDVLKAAARQLGVLAAGETLRAEDATTLLELLNRVLDGWNADRQAVYRDTFTIYPITPSLQPHTIGPTGATWSASQRPVELVAAMLVLTDSARIPLALHQGPEGAQWWADVRNRVVTSSVPTDLFYDPSWPNGNVYLWPIPAAAYSIELTARLVLSNLALADTFSLPPGYLDALVLTLTEDAAPEFGATLAATIPFRAAKARARIFGANAETPYISTADDGLSTGTTGKVDWHLGPFALLKRN